LEVQGASATSICFRHLIPNMMPLIVAQATILFGYAMVDLAAISFLGLGVQPPEPNWGVMISENQVGLAEGPAILILDESVAALDVSIQAQVLNLLADIRDETAVSYVLISHDLAVVRQLTDEAIVLHRGEVVERGRTAQILDDPQHPYTQRLRASVPRPGWKPVRRA
jgi:Binding-protein-dependent transport system inner membrane component/Oligopeptide/dipeptide transporter, C-terminal region